MNCCKHGIILVRWERLHRFYPSSRIHPWLALMGVFCSALSPNLHPTQLGGLSRDRMMFRACPVSSSIVKLTSPILAYIYVLSFVLTLWTKVHQRAKIMKSTEVQTLGALWRARVSKRMRCITNRWAGFSFSCYSWSLASSRSLTRANYTTR